MNATAPAAAGRPRRPFVLTVFLFALGYLSYFLCQVLFLILAAPLLVVSAPFPGFRARLPRVLVRGFLAFFARWWLPALGLYRIEEVSGLDRALACCPAVFVANHRGFMDSLFLLSLAPRMGVLIKSRYARHPMYRLLVRYFDLVSIQPGLISSVAAALEACQRLLDGGKNLLVFPEGTRARSGRLQVFNTLAFELALESHRPIVPVIVHSTEAFMARVPHSVFPRGDNQYRIRFLEPEPVRPGDTAESVCDRVYLRMAKELKALDAGTRWDTLR